ncbi:hypothetical protein JCGZ_22715 [Jatropha curcas]|uniref:Uncharacterized protein n=1 Tax=Jatropha curcas TaxID=180498 RepID=A0A067K145_JATCU|nr:hypothetical protein JCGZ_22715 [Jatropha curcas]
MARGRAVDSDASDNGPRGGRGRGRSTRGQGGTIPPPSSSGMSGASSSAQPSVPPPLPSIPSSSTPFPRPEESSPASESPTTPASSEPRNKLSFVAGHIYPSSRASRQIIRIIKLHLDKDGYTWDVHFLWEEAITTMLKVAWEKLCALWYADFSYRMRKSVKKHQCVSQEIWESWQKAWEDLVFKRKCEIFARNRQSETGDDGAGPSRRTGGSISAIETSRLLVSQLVIVTKLMFNEMTLY